MQDKPTKPEQQSPADIAREAFRRLAARRIAPTPDAYREIYDEIAGVREQSSAEKVLADFTASLTDGPSEVEVFSRQLAESLKARDWESYGKHFKLFIEKHLTPVAEDAAPLPEAAKPATANAVNAAPTKQEETVPVKTASIPLVDDIPPLPVKKHPIPLVDDIEPPPSRVISIPLVDDIEPLPSRTGSIPLVDDIDDMEQPESAAPDQVLNAVAPPLNDGHLTRMLREMLVRTLTLPVTSLLQDAPELAKDAESLAGAINGARSKQALTEIEARLKQFCFRVDMKSGDMAEERELLLRLFKLLLENVGELLEDDSWLSGQIANVREIISGPINYAVLMDAIRSMKEVIYKQSMLKHSLSEAKARIKDMILTVIDRLGAVAASTGDYHKKIDGYTQKISQAKGTGDLNRVLDDILRDTLIAQTATLQSQNDMITARQEVQSAETRISELESQLAAMSELAHEDQLTGSLNRRGLDDVLEREFARSERKKAPLCVALLDLDDFKRLNDTHGHSAGDGALIHLVRVVKNTLRTMDIIGRFGGEEFLVVLPNTPLEDAAQTITRLQRELTKQIFMHENKRLLITFSAGVALRKANEEQETLIKRADEALYKAKRAGKNRVVSAD